MCVYACLGYNLQPVICVKGTTPKTDREDELSCCRVVATHLQNAGDQK